MQIGEGLEPGGQPAQHHLLPAPPLAKLLDAPVSDVQSLHYNNSINLMKVLGCRRNHPTRPLSLATPRAGGPGASGSRP